MQYTFFLALRYIFGKKEKWISISALLASIGIMLGVATLIIVLSVMQGFRNTMLDNLLAVQGHIVIVNPNIDQNIIDQPISVATQVESKTKESKAMEEKALKEKAFSANSNVIINYEQIIKKIMKHKAVKKTTPILEQQFMATHYQINPQNNTSVGASFGILTHSMPKKYLKQSLETSAVINKIKMDALKVNTRPMDNIPMNTTQIYIGKQIATDFNIQIGDNITLTSAKTIETPFGNTPLTQTFTVAGLCDFPFFQYNKMLCLVDLEDTQNFLNIVDCVTNILVFIKNPNQVQEVKADLIEILSQTAETKHLKVISWEENNITFAQVLNMQRNIMFIVISMMIIIASFNGISSLMMLVKEKSKEIAILKVLGSKKAHILSIFLFAGLIISLTSIILGLCLGLIGAYYLDSIRQIIENIFHINIFPEDFYHLSKIPIYLDFIQILWIVLWCMLLSLAAILYPCWKALQIEPDRELRI